MGRTSTPKYRLELVVHGGSLTPIAWSGNATHKRLVQYLADLARSFRPGGVNCCGGRIEIVGGSLIRQSDDVVVATHTVPSNTCKRCGQHGIGPCGCGFQAEGAR